jgi:hypothetical protein
LSVLWITFSDCPFLPCLFCHCFVCLTIQWQNRQGTKEQSETVMQRTENTMTKQTRDKRAIRRCNSKDEQNRL